MELVATLPDGDLGFVNFHTRTIQVRKGMDRTAMWHTLWHERAHLILWDSGMTNGLNSDLEEALCDAFATAMVAEMVSKIKHSTNQE